MLHRHLRAVTWSLLTMLLILAAPAPVEAAPPAGFTVVPIGGSWNELAGVTFLDDGRTIAWERGGRLWMIDANGNKAPSPMLDLSEEVGAWRDHGLLGVALHPNFLNNGRIYLLYVVDRHHLLNFGTPQYNPNSNAYFAASIGRITRYTATAASNFTQVDPDSRLVLLGESITTGIPIVHQSHGVGTILFGVDGTLLVSVGDSASYESNDFGGQVSGGYVNQALADGILTAKENVGAFRSQLVDSLCGKILRLNPETGDGVPSNPFFDPSAPRAPRSRVFALGLRNPFRMELIPGTGSHNPAVGLPGTLLIGDVGWNVREEINLCDAPAQNFGWPIFEGLEYLNAYATNGAFNLDAPNNFFNPLGTPPCSQPFFPFRELLLHDTMEHDPLFVNGCGLYQAEHATLSGAIVVTDVPGFTGNGYVDYQNPSNDFIEWKATIPATGPFTLHFRYALGAAGNRPLRVTVDGVEVAAALDFPSTGSWTRNEWSTLTVNLTAGVRRIRATAIGQSGPNIDALAVTAPGGSPPAIDGSIPRFVHRRPALDFVHGPAQAHVPGFNGTVPVALLVGSPGSGVVGAPFSGFCAIGGSRVEPGPWPAAWHGTHLFADFASLFIRGVKLDADGRVTEVQVFDPSAGPVVMARYNPINHSLWVVRWGNQLVRIQYAPGTNQPPIAVAQASPSYGPSPLLVTLDASASSDPEGSALTFTWSLPDGSRPLEGPVVQHLFTGDGPTRHEVHLTVRDTAGLETSLIVPVWTDNTPPMVHITSVHDGDLYSMESKTILPLIASISDAEHRDLSCAWVTTLYHNTHNHPEPADPECTTSTVITPLGCGDELYFYGITLTVTDPLGLATTKSLFIYPDCKGVLLCPADLNGNGVVDGADLAVVLGLWGTTGEGLIADLNHDHLVDGNDLAVVLGSWGECP
ncbi:MAG: PQQ-dependent sugar dehydrogenase [Phycisphaeraceae bacterium]|nr:PQQ-dependent sugar dehydrogenase [Phycisphaeraceae bacterium]